MAASAASRKAVSLVELLRRGMALVYDGRHNELTPLDPSETDVRDQLVISDFKELVRGLRRGVALTRGDMYIIFGAYFYATGNNDVDLLRTIGALLLDDYQLRLHYSRGMDAASALKAAAISYGLPDEVAEAIRELAANAMRETTDRETTDRAPAEPRPDAAAQAARTPQELFGVSASRAARRYHKSDGPEFSKTELADRGLLAIADKICNDMKKRSKTLSPEDREMWRLAKRFTNHARKLSND
jgi:hypothetical protein